MRSVVIAPSLIYGLGHGLNSRSIQVPWLIQVAKKFGVAKHIGPGENRWANVHIDDLMALYVLAIEKAPAGAFYYAENGENSMREVCEAISRMLGQGGRTQSMTVEEAVTEWGEGPANDTMGSNSRVRAKRARAELKWRPKTRSLIDEIERGCYAQSSKFRAGDWDHKPIIWRRANVRFVESGLMSKTKTVIISPTSSAAGERWFLSSRMQSVEIGDREATLDTAGFD